MNNSIEAIIALTALLSFIMALLLSLSFYNTTIGENEKDFLAKNNAVNCAIIVDSFFSNNAKEFVGSFDCSGENNFVSFGEINPKKSFVLTRVKKEKFLEIETDVHYK